MHTFILALILLAYGLANFALGVYFAASVEQKLAAAKAIEQGEAVKIISVIDQLKAFWAKVTKLL